MEDIQLIIQSILVLVYVVGGVILFRLQNREIKRLKSITETMNSYMSIFDIEKVREFAKMNEELANNKAVKFATEMIKDNKEMEKIVATAVTQAEDKFGMKLRELTVFCSSVINAIPEPDRTELINQHFPNSSELFQPSPDDAKNTTEHNS
ncbi:MAG: hypothetical protein JJ975_12870 [Bacteroidia bacterium]|nr:hypothetical protein [Bacteroidia bacterium]